MVDRKFPEDIPIDLPGEAQDILYDPRSAYILKRLGEEYKKEEKGFYLLIAISRCALYEYPIPQWCGEALLAIMERWSSGECREFGDAINIKRSKGWDQSAHLARSKKVPFGPLSITKQKWIALNVEKWHRKGYKKDRKVVKSAFAMAAKECGLGEDGERIAERYYYEVKKTFERGRKRVEKFKAGLFTLEDEFQFIIGSTSEGADKD